MRARTCTHGTQNRNNTAPMGWSSWNVYAGGVDEQKIMSTIDAMATMKTAGCRWMIRCVAISALTLVLHFTPPLPRSLRSSHLAAFPVVLPPSHPDLVLKTRCLACPCAPRRRVRQHRRQLDGTNSRRRRKLTDPQGQVPAWDQVPRRLRASKVPTVPTVVGKEGSC
jgi:hypothetical protein